MGWPLLLAAPLAGCLSAPEDVAVIHEPLRVCADGDTLDGIDVSHHQETIDWDDVAGAGIDFAFIRVSDGLYQDREFTRNWAEARRVGIIRGVYQFFRPGRDAVDQADLLLERMGTLQADDLPPVLDVEDADGYSASTILAGIEAWMTRIEEATGRVPIIYTGKYFWQDEVGASTANADHPLWIAQYGRTCPDLPDQWADWAFWQTSESGRVAGVTGAVDTDLFNGNREALLALTAATSECGDGTCGPGESMTTCAADCPDTRPPFGSWIGGPCRNDADCLTNTCLTDGYPDGMCTEACDRFCPDRAGSPVTFCAEVAGEGRCFSRQSYEHFPSTGCRERYRAQTLARYNQPATRRTVCTPTVVTSGEDSDWLPIPAPDDGTEPPQDEGQFTTDLEDLGEGPSLGVEGSCSAVGPADAAPLWLALLVGLAVARRRPPR
jgi:MYXO-CTERM domain-containing protein